MIWLYRLLFLPALLLALPYYLLRMWRRGGYAKDFQHRFGAFRRLPPPEPGRCRIWIQAVSVGEVLAVGPLIEALQARGNVDIVLTTTTSTGYSEARKRYASRILSVGIFPLDFCLFSRRAWQRIQPDAILLTESELWPEHLHQAKVRGVPAYLINARMSDRSFQRYQKAGALIGRLLKKFTRIYPASQTDLQRFQELGAIPDCLEACGSIKLDAPAPEPMDAAAKVHFLSRIGLAVDHATSDPPLILLGASTWPGEEAILINVVNDLVASGIDCRLILVPRHAERAPEVLPLLEKQPLSWHQRSRTTPPAHPAMLLLADTTGELGQFTRVADLAFVGKSLAPNRGGQSPIDAAALGVPLLFGPNMGNFADIAQALQTEGAAIRVADAEELQRALKELARDAAARADMGAAGRNWHSRNRGSSQRIADSIIATLPC